MKNEIIFWIGVVGFGYVYACATSVLKAAMDWAALLIGREFEEGGGKLEDIPPAHLLSFLSVGSQNLLPMKFGFYNNWIVILGVIFILSGFIWVHWVSPIIALIAFFKVLPFLLTPLVQGRCNGHKSLLIKGLDAKIVRLKLGSDQGSLDSCRELREWLELTEWPLK